MLGWGRVGAGEQPHSLLGNHGTNLLDPLLTSLWSWGGGGVQEGGVHGDSPGLASLGFLGGTGPKQGSGLLVDT